MLWGFPQSISSVPNRFGSCFCGGNDLCARVVRFRPPFPSGIRFGCPYSLSVGFPPYLASNPIQRLHCPLYDVEGIDAAFAGRSELVDAIRDPSGTVPSNDPYAGQLPGCQLAVKLFQNLLAMSLGRPDDGIGIVIDNNGDVLVAFSVAGLVNTDVDNVIKAP